MAVAADAAAHDGASDGKSFGWERLPDMPTPRAYSIGGYHEEKLYVLGGCDVKGKALSVAEVYDFSSKSWHQLPNMPTRRAASTGLVFHEGKMIVVGGVDENQVPIAAVDAFDIHKETWEQLPRLPIGVVGPYVIKVDEKLYVFGGTDKKEANQSVVLDLDRNEWNPLPPMPTRRYACAGYLHKNKVYIVSGRDGSTAVKACEAFDLETQQWEELAPMVSIRVFFNAIGYKDHIYVIGGIVPMVGMSKIVERYSIKENKWIRLNDMSIARSDGSIGIVGDRIVLAGGLGMIDDKPASMTEVLAFTKRGRHVDKLPSMPTGRTSTSTLLFKGKMAVIGGVGGVGGGPQSVVEILSIK